MKKKGFTLIELLAVIVVLAIIALIATPIVMNVISNAEKGAAERSADNYIKAVETLIATNALDGKKVKDGIYTIDSNGNLQFGDVEVSGTKSNGGRITIKDGRVVRGETTITIGDHAVSYKDEKVEAKELAKLLDVCSLKSSTPNVVGAEYLCNLGDGDRTFYVLEAGTTSNPATLILYGNYDTMTLAWCDQNGDNPKNNSCHADGLELKLDEIALAWNKLGRSQIEIPSMEQIMVADGRGENDYEGGQLQLSNKFLYRGYPTTDTTTQGYWTSTGSPTNAYYALLLNRYGQTASNYVYSDDLYGIRPIIELSI
ncbi:MAG: type II secretion system protein [Firmicutes bacterium]|nr:type II secretion system protein [Bacillota bacterium]